MRTLLKHVSLLGSVLLSLVWIMTALAFAVIIKLNDDFTTQDSNIESFLVSHDGNSIVYGVAGQTENTVFELFSVPPAGGVNVQLNPSFTTTQQYIGGYKISSDDAYVVYEVNRIIYATPMLGGNSTELASIYCCFEVAANNNRVVYTVDPQNSGLLELYSVSIDGSDGIRLNDPLASQESIYRFEITKNGDYVVYTIDDNSNLYDDKLLSVPVGGGVPVTLAQNGGTFKLSPNNDFVLYLNGYRDKLYSIPVTGGIKTHLGDEADNFEISPDGKFVVYRTDDDGRNNLYSVPVTGGQGVHLTNVASFFGDNYWITPDSNHVIFVDQHDLYQVPIVGGNMVRLNGAVQLSLIPAWLGSYMRVEMSKDGQYVVFIGKEAAGAPYELYSVPVMGGAVVKVNGALVSGGELFVDHFEISEDSRRVIYIADQDENDILELYSTSITGGDVEKLNQALTLGGDVYNFNLVPNSPRVIYRADQETNNVIELFATFALAATPDTYIVRQDDSLNIAEPGVLDNDLQSGSATTELLTPPVHGNLIFNSDGSFTYTPDAEFWGKDSFTYFVSEAQQDSNVVTVTLSIVKDALYFPIVLK
ncbi:MAG: hypothetical protein GY943_10990 [Chloroflexi bacterium]|nr:hypothetical protein [Chloroflexota bacterium]